MHQGHNIPWSAFEKYFTFVVDSKRYTPPFTGLVYNQNPAAAKELQHFARKFAATVKEFSETERKKYPSKLLSVSTTDKLFSYELRDKYPGYLKERFQSLSSWIDCSKDLPHGGFRDAVMVLLFENKIETLLMLAHHPQIAMARILEFGCAHYQSMPGEESALSAYLFFNTMEAVGQLYNGNYTRMRDYWYLTETILTGSGYCGQQVVHEVLLPRSDMHSVRFPKENLVHTHIEDLREYLKGLFAMLYKYDVLAREVGVDPQWERRVKDNIISQGGLPKETVIDENNNYVFIALDV